MFHCHLSDNLIHIIKNLYRKFKAHRKPLISEGLVIMLLNTGINMYLLAFLVQQLCKE